MILDYETLKLIWWVLIGVLLIGFAVTDGMDMGSMILMPFLGRTDNERRTMINTIAPHWDGNQVWFITAGGAIFAAWPEVYAVAFSGFYMAMLLTLFALFFRPVGFDYRSKLENSRWRNAWDWALFGGSLVPALVFGVAFGNLLQGVPFQYGDLMRAVYVGNFWQLLNPYGLLAGILSIAMLAMHGGAWMMARADQAVAERARIAVILLALVVLVLFALGGLWLWMGEFGFRIESVIDGNALPIPQNKDVVVDGIAWISNFDRHPSFWIAPMLGLFSALVVALLALARRPALALIMSSLTIAGVITTAGFAMFPFIMPSSLVPSDSLTLWDATSSLLTLKIMFWVAIVMVPIILAYTTWAYVKMWRRISVRDIEENTHALY